MMVCSLTASSCSQHAHAVQLSFAANVATDAMSLLTQLLIVAGNLCWYNQMLGLGKSFLLAKLVLLLHTLLACIHHSPDAISFLTGISALLNILSYSAMSFQRCVVEIPRRMGCTA